MALTFATRILRALIVVCLEMLLENRVAVYPSYFLHLRKSTVESLCKTFNAINTE